MAPHSSKFSSSQYQNSKTCLPLQSKALLEVSVELQMTLEADFPLEKALHRQQENSRKKPFQFK